ncbi:hypothetical protein DM01DRAFT_1300696 [Hesseltinella vesiculosa]|uniref:TBP-associated factor 12 n=1 Tax=Hesseltinella vesiculosa TaxID=101127 RepID=A0A1X2GS43_9FUNG|nr:hypothetical protein DM01DRAFT_1300696 [Hesseltinella vesiculosa]
MAANPNQGNAMPAQPQQQIRMVVTQCQHALEVANNNLNETRQKLEQPNLTNEERDRLRATEQDLQQRLVSYQIVLRNLLNPQLQQQQALALIRRQQQLQQQQPNPSTPGSPAQFMPANAMAANQMRPTASPGANATNVSAARPMMNPQVPMNNTNLSPHMANLQQQQGMYPAFSTAGANPAMQQMQAMMQANGSPNVTGSPSNTNTSAMNFAASQPPMTNVTNLAAVAAAAAAQAANQSSTGSPAGMVPAAANVGSFNITSTPTSAPMPNVNASTGMGPAPTTSASSSSTSLNPAPSNTKQKKAQAAQAAAQANSNQDLLDADGVPRVLAKRKIQELVGQIDPTERLEPEVEDILLEVADEFIESVTTFACRLAKHRKSDTLEVKDLQLHLERNWNIRIPGFASDDIRSLRKTVIPTSYHTKVQAVNQAKSQPPSRKDTS